MFIWILLGIPVGFWLLKKLGDVAETKEIVRQMPNSVLNNYGAGQRYIKEAKAANRRSESPTSF